MLVIDEPPSRWFIPAVVSYVIKSNKMINQSMDARIFMIFPPFFLSRRGEKKEEKSTAKNGKSSGPANTQ